MTQCAKGATDGTVGQKLVKFARVVSDRQTNRHSHHNFAPSR